jgi:hypothetical protein
VTRTKRAVLALVVCLASLSMLGAAVAQEQPYNNSSGNTSIDNWTEGHETVDLENVTHYVSRVGTFVIGDAPGDAGAGPVFVGILVGALAVSAMGTSRAGLVASGTMAVIVVAGLSAPLGAGLLPSWLYGTVVLIVALVAGVLYIRMVR